MSAGPTTEVLSPCCPAANRFLHSVDPEPIAFQGCSPLSPYAILLWTHWMLSLCDVSSCSYLLPNSCLPAADGWRAASAVRIDTLIRPDGERVCFSCNSFSSGQKCSAQSLLAVHSSWRELGLLEKVEALASRRSYSDLTLSPVLSHSNQDIQEHVDVSTRLHQSLVEPPLAWAIVALRAPNPQVTVSLAPLSVPRRKGGGCITHRASFSEVYLLPSKAILLITLLASLSVWPAPEKDCESGVSACYLLSASG